MHGVLEELDLQTILHNVLTTTDALSPAVVSALLLEADTGFDDERGFQQTGYPQQPYYKEVARVLYVWMDSGAYPIKLIAFPVLVDDKSEYARVEELTGEILQCKKEWISSNDSSQDFVTKTQLMCRILQLLGIRGVLTLLRMRKTASSLDVVPPRFKDLIDSFNVVHVNRLSVGARALSKHYLRTNDRWWGVLKGNDVDKSKQAEVILRKLLDGSAWINAHMLPHDIQCFEVRTAEGYGGRWVAKENAATEGFFGSGAELIFRGFLEPAMEGGHEKGWKH